MSNSTWPPKIDWHEPTRKERNLSILDYEGWINGRPVPPMAAFDGWNGFGFDPAHLEAYTLRSETIKNYGFAIPCAEVIEALRPLQPLVEIGAGTGYWSAILNKNGVRIDATDVNRKVVAGRMVVFDHGRHFPVKKMTALQAVRLNPFANFLCVWPSLDGTWARNAAKAIMPGKHLALVSEGRGGCCAEDGLWKVLDKHFEHVNYVNLPQWPGIHDRLDIYRRIK